MRDLAWIVRANEEQVGRELREALSTGDNERAMRIMDANVDLYGEHHAIDVHYQDEGGEAG